MKGEVRPVGGGPWRVCATAFLREFSVRGGVGASPPGRAIARAGYSAFSDQREAKGREGSHSV